MASSGTSSFPGRWDVFLSFRGEDTRLNFTDHLYSALTSRGIHTFRDDEGLERGGEIQPSLLKAIEESKVSIVVFSKNYAHSQWCLDELDKIMDFGEAFARYGKVTEERVQRWRAALTQAGGLSGWHVEHGYESEIIDRITQNVSNMLKPKRLHNPWLETINGFGSGSRIVITTRDKHILDAHGVDQLYEVRGLESEEAFQLFCSNAFKKNLPEEGYCDLSNLVVNYCRGLPLALEVLGSYLYGKTIPQWESELDRLQREPQIEIQRTWQWSRLWHPRDVLHTLISNTATEAIEAISLDLSALEELLASEEIQFTTKAFKNMRKLRLLRCFTIFPESLMESLKFLTSLAAQDLRKRFPEITEVMEHLEELLLDGTSIRELPRSIHYLKDCQRPGMLQCLRRLQADETAITNHLSHLLLHRENSDDIGLQLPSCQCEQLQKIPKLPPSIKLLDACDCTSLMSLPTPSPMISPQHWLVSTWLRPVKFMLWNCSELYQNHVATALETLHQKLFPEIGYSILIPGSRIPKWRWHEYMGASVSATLPPHWLDNNFLGLLYVLCLHLRRAKLFSGLVRFAVILKAGKGLISVIPSLGHTVETELLRRITCL
ncbi:Toll/interleukin-1 receptor-like protein [Vitis vinifera]|uniref:ADP-ribosyl cyclase/cyclic ADP-ribose hydrolase n=1 Tax=Vitis vinifera TaxID=29760 RepID=A0A438FVS6_VITVI|nr:Toll/interleukin-1 receptor-like protein [Vitis vinifera]